MFGPILCMYEIKILLDQDSNVCGLLNRLDEMHAKPTLNHLTNQKMVPFFVRVHLVIFSTQISQGASFS